MVWLGRLTRLGGLCILLLTAASAPAGTAGTPVRINSAAVDSLPLPRALAVFSAATHLQLVYVSQLALGKVSQAVPAGLPVETALEQLLAGTGLDFLFLNSRTVKLFETPRTTRLGGTEAGRASLDNHRVGERSADESLAEVVVTATKRDAMLSSVPMSIRVLAPDNLDASGMQGITGIAAVTTGIEYDFSSQYGPGILSNIAIRGIGADKGDATTGIYVNDMPIQTPHTTFGNAYPVNFDLAQVEVLRGPQGVLFGRGAEGGAIRYVTNEASATQTSQLYRAEVSTTARGGTSAEFGAAAGGPLIDGVLGARLSVWYREDAGYVNHIDPFSGAVIDANANRTASRALRMSFAYEPNESLRIMPLFSHQSIDLHDTPVFYAAPPPPHAGALDNGKLLRQPAVDDLDMASLKLVQRVGTMTITGVTSYMDRFTTATVDTTNVAGAAFFGGFGNPLGPAFPVSYADAVPTLLTVHQIILSEEVRVASTDSTAPWQWLGGLFFSRLRQDSTQDTYLIAAPDVPGILTDDYNTLTETSAFGQVRYSLNPYLTAGTGVRVGWLNSRSFSSAQGFATAGPLTNRHTSSERLPPTPRFDLSYQPDSRNLFYAAIAKGFRAGGYGGQAARCGSTQDPSAFGPDSVWSFELGAKNQLVDRRLSLDASLFDIHWNDIQQRVQDPCGNSFTTNVGAARSSGFDLTVDASVTDRLHAALAVGYLDVRYTRTLRASSGSVLVERGTVVGGVPSVPAPWSGTMSARYEWPLARGASGYVHAEEIVHSHNTGPFTELTVGGPTYDPRLVADPAIYVLNLQVGITWVGANLRLFVNNAANAQPLLQRDIDAPGSALVYAYTQRPRTVGLLGNWSF